MKDCVDNDISVGSLVLNIKSTGTITIGKVTGFDFKDNLGGDVAKIKVMFCNRNHIQNKETYSNSRLLLVIDEYFERNDNITLNQDRKSSKLKKDSLGNYIMPDHIIAFHERYDPFVKKSSATLLLGIVTHYGPRGSCYVKAKYYYDHNQKKLKHYKVKYEISPNPTRSVILNNHLRSQMLKAKLTKPTIGQSQ